MLCFIHSPLSIQEGSVCEKLVIFVPFLHYNQFHDLTQVITVVFTTIWRKGFNYHWEFLYEHADSRKLFLCCWNDDFSPSFSSLLPRGRSVVSSSLATVLPWLESQVVHHFVPFMLPRNTLQLFSELCLAGSDHTPQFPASDFWMKLLIYTCTLEFGFKYVWKWERNYFCSVFVSGCINWKVLETTVVPKVAYCRSS